MFSTWRGRHDALVRIEIWVEDGDAALSEVADSGGRNLGAGVHPELRE